MGIRTLLGKSEGELSGWEHLRKTGQAWVGTSPVWEVGLLGAPETIMAGYCPRVLGGMTMSGAFRPSLDASRGGSRIVLVMTGPIREHNQGARILATETVEDEGGDLVCFDGTAEALQLIGPWTLRGRTRVEASLAPAETTESVVCKGGVKCSWGLCGLLYRSVMGVLHSGAPQLGCLPLSAGPSLCSSPLIFFSVLLSGGS